MEKKQYSNSFHTLEAIWRVLRRYSSRRHPLTVREIYEHLERLESEPPSLPTIKRALPGGLELMEQLFPGRVATEDGARSVTAYGDGSSLHIVLETPEGEILGQDSLGVSAVRRPFRAPCYAAVYKLLKEGIPFDLDTFPYRLRCVAQVPGRNGAVVTMPYDEWEERVADAGKKSTVHRRYYLTNELTNGEWRMFSDLVRSYPYISERQTQKFLRVLDRLCPRRLAPARGRYVFKRGSADRLRIIGKLDRAVEERRKVRLTCGTYRLEFQDGVWAPVLKPREQDAVLDVEAYDLIWANGNYYLVGNSRGMVNLRTDRIMSAELLNERFKVPDDFDLMLHRDSSPLMCPGEKAFIRLRCRESMLNVLVDFFGNLAHYSAPQEDGMLEVTMAAAPQSLKLFALQHLNDVEVLEPEELRQELQETLRAGVEMYTAAEPERER